MAAPEAKFTFKFEEEGSDEFKSLSKETVTLSEAMAKSEAKIKDAGNALKRLKGNSLEVVAARSQLKAILNSERAVMSANALSLAKLGTTYEKVSAQKKKLEDAKLKKAAEANKELAQTFEPLTSKLGVFKGLLDGSTSGTKLAVLGVAGLAAAVVALTVALAAGVVVLAKWAIGAANTARSMGLMREAATGSAQDAANLGIHIDVLAKKVPTAKAALNDLAVSLRKGGTGGQTLVDTLNAVAQASAALGDDAGNKLREFIDRGRLTQRFQVNPLELQGTGLKFDDVAKSLSKNLKVGINEARQALLEGRVRLGDGAKALRDAVESKFAGINLRKMLDLNVMAEKFGETLDELTGGINLEPLLEGISDIASVFSTSTESGAALKDMVTAFGNALGTTVKENAPLMKNFIRGLIIGALDVGIAYYKLRNAFRDAFGDKDTKKNIDWLKVALKAGEIIIGTFATGLVLTGALIAAAFAPFVFIGSQVVGALEGIWVAGKAVVEWWEKTDFTALGKGLVDGLLKGIQSGKDRVVSGVKGLATDVKNAFKDALGIKSPSKVFAEYGKFTAKGFTQGVDEGSDGANDAVASMVDRPTLPAGTSQGGANKGGDITINLGGIVVHVPGNGQGTTAEAVGSSLASEDFMGKLAKALQDAFGAAGVPART